MRDKIKSFLGRHLIKSSKFKPLVSVAISRIAVLKHQRQARLSQARSDVIQLLRQGYHQRALLRVEQVIKEQNMLDVYDMLESYCNLLIERVHLIEHERECPEELREATSSMVYAASRCGDFPELQEIRALLTGHFGKEFAARAVELRNNCGVSHMMIQKLSTRQPSLESRMAILREMASENSIVLQLDQESSSVSYSTQVMVEDEDAAVLESKKNKYKDVADAAQAAFESAANAATAARAAVELSKSGPGHGPGGPSPSLHSASSLSSDSTTSAAARAAVELSKSGHGAGPGPGPGPGPGGPSPPLHSVSSLSSDSTTSRVDDATPVPLNLDRMPFSVRTRPQLRGF